jgi:hypothetical protein
MEAVPVRCAASPPLPCSSRAPSIPAVLHAPASAIPAPRVIPILENLVAPPEISPRPRPKTSPTSHPDRSTQTSCSAVMAVDTVEEGSSPSPVTRRSSMEGTTRRRGPWGGRGHWQSEGRCCPLFGESNDENETPSTPVPRSSTQSPPRATTISMSLFLKRRHRAGVAT